MSRRRLLLVATALIVAVALGYFLLPARQKPLTQQTPIQAITQIPKVQAPEGTTTSETAVVESKKCLPAGIALTFTGPMSESDFRTMFSSLGAPIEKDTHWTNHGIEKSGKNLILHLVRSEGAQGQETWVIKTFDDSEDGPVMLKEETFLTKTEATRALDQELGKANLRYRQDIKTHQYPGNVSVKHDVEDGMVTSFVLQSPQGRLSCEGSSCACL